MLAYIVARSLGKFLAGFGGSLLSGIKPRQAAWFGLGSLPQAGVAVGLALSATIDYPEVGATVTAVVLASIVFFELVGPPATKKALVELGCTDHTEDEDFEELVCRERMVLVPVSHHWSAEKLTHVLDATDEENDCMSTFVLSMVVTPAKAYTQAEALMRAQTVLDKLAKVAKDAGHPVMTRVVQARQIDVAISELAEEIHADLVVLGTPAVGSRGVVTSFVRSPLHKIIDRLTAPVFIIPEGWEPREIATRVSTTTRAGENAVEPAVESPSAEEGVGEEGDEA